MRPFAFIAISMQCRCNGKLQGSPWRNDRFCGRLHSLQSRCNATATVNCKEAPSGMTAFGADAVHPSLGFIILKGRPVWPEGLPFSIIARPWLQTRRPWAAASRRGRSARGDVDSRTALARRRSLHENGPLVTLSRNWKTTGQSFSSSA